MNIYLFRTSDPAAVGTANLAASPFYRRQAIGFGSLGSLAAGQNLRVVAYNIEADIRRCHHAAQRTLHGARSHRPAELQRHRPSHRHPGPRGNHQQHRHRGSHRDRAQRLLRGGHLRVLANFQGNAAGHGGRRQWTQRADLQHDDGVVSAPERRAGCGGRRHSQQVRRRVPAGGPLRVASRSAVRRRRPASTCTSAT